MCLEHLEAILGQQNKVLGVLIAFGDLFTGRFGLLDVRWDLGAVQEDFFSFLDALVVAEVLRFC